MATEFSQNYFPPFSLASKCSIVSSWEEIQIASSPIPDHINLICLKIYDQYLDTIIIGTEHFIFLCTFVFVYGGAVRIQHVATPANVDINNWGGDGHRIQP